MAQRLLVEKWKDHKSMKTYIPFVVGGKTETLAAEIVTLDWRHQSAKEVNMIV